MVRATTASWALSAILVLSACGGDESAASGSGGGGATSCPTGQVDAPGGGCMPVGIQGCADIFIEDDGLCHPSLDKCPPGTIPNFSEGCTAVGIPNCAPEFVEDDGLCHPSRDKCPPGSFAVPTEGCVSIDGDGCGSGSWGLIADARGTVWVDPSYAGGMSDGSQEAPFTTVAAALAAVAPGGRIALAAGDYAEPVTIDQPLELVGRCPSLVTLSGTQSTPYTNDPVIVLADGAAGALVRGVRLSGAGIGLLAIGGDVELSGVHIQQVTAIGVVVAQGTLHVTRSLVEATLSQPASGAFGRGIDVEAGASLSLDKSALAENRDVGLYVATGTTVTVSDALIENTLPQQSDLAGGRGIEVQEGASLSLDKSALVENREAALFAAGAGTMVTVNESLIENTLSQQSDLARGNGIGVQEGASLSLDKSVLAENRDVGLVAGSTGTTVTVSESLIEDTLPRESDLAHGRGIGMQQGASLSLDKSALAENHEVALFAADGGTTVTVSESLIENTLPRQSNLAFGWGIDVQEGASLSLDKSALAENRGMALVAGHAGTTVTVSESLVERTLPQESDGAYGAGLLGTAAATLRVSGSAVCQSQTAGVLVSYGATVEIAGSFIDEVLPGRFHTYEGPPNMEVIVATYDGVGEGLVVAFGSNATAVTDTVVVRASRAGIMFESSTGLLRTVHSTENRFGLVLQGAPQPDWQHESNLFQGSEQSIVNGGNLPVPEAPPVPEG